MNRGPYAQTTTKPPPEIVELIGATFTLRREGLFIDTYDDDTTGEEPLELVTLVNLEAMIRSAINAKLDALKKAEPRKPFNHWPVRR